MKHYTLRRELREKQKMVIPLLLDRKVKADTLPSFLADKRCADFRTHFDRGLAERLRAVEGRRGHEEERRNDVIMFLRDMMVDAIEIVRKRYPEYKVAAVRERGNATKKWFSCGGDPGNGDICWHFDLEKIKPDDIGPTRITAELYPIWDIATPLFPAVNEIMLFSNTKNNEGEMIKVKHLPCNARDAELVLFHAR